MKYFTRVFTTAFSLALIAGVCNGQGERSRPPLSAEASSHSTSAGEESIPEALRSPLAEVKAKTSVPVLLPSKLAKPFGNAKHAVVQKATANEYGISLYFELNIGDAGFAAFFSGETSPGFHPQELPNVSKIKLSHGIWGYFRPVSCGGSCAPANLWWEEGSAVYTIQLKLASSTKEEEQEKIISAVANSALLAGPR